MTRPDLKLPPVWAVGFAFVLAAAACDDADESDKEGEDPPAAPKVGEQADTDRRSVLLLTVDTLRADHTSLDGYARETTPELDAFFAEGTVYDAAYSATAKTASSVFSYMTGKWPQNHGIRLQYQKIPEDLVTLATLLDEAGYQTAAVVSNSVLTREATGFDAQFDYYDDYVHQREAHRNYWERTARKTTDAALRWIDHHRDPDKPIFLWVHYMDPHGPYRPPEDKPVDFTHEVPIPIEFDRIQGYCREPGNNDAHDYIDRYDEEIAYFDHHAKRLVDRWEQLAPVDESLVVFTSDHGESMMDHEKWFRHDYHIYEELVRVPLALRGPGFDEARVAERVPNMDVAPTILQFAGVEPPADLDARPLGEDPSPRHVFVESFYRNWQWRGVLEAGSPRKYMLLMQPPHPDRPYKKQRWYHLEEDPREQHERPWPRKAKPTPGARALLQHIEADEDLGRERPRRFVARGRRLKGPKEVPAGISPDVTEEQLEKLRALGYAE